MTDFKALNKPIIEAITFFLGDKPGMRRGAPLMDAIASNISVLYHNVSNAEKAVGFNQLAFEMRRLGYADECIYFAQISSALDKNNHKLAINNLSVEAYARGFIQGNYEHGLDLYRLVDKLLQENGQYDETAAIKSSQNQGQLYHRMGMNNTSHYHVALDCFDEAFLALSASKTLSDKERLQYRGQLGYCYAKTLTHMARVYPDDASTYLNRAMDQINHGMDYVSTLEGFDFERACFKAVLGDVHAAMGDYETATLYLKDALENQRKFGPTLAPRIASTLMKLDALQPPKLVVDVKPQDNPYMLLQLFHGHESPDLKYYQSNPRLGVAKAPKPAIS